MAMPSDRNQREYTKFVQTAGGNTAVRVVGSSGSTQLDVNTASVESSALIGKSGTAISDFTLSYDSATTIEYSSLPTFVSNLDANDIVSIEQYSSAGVQTKRYTRDDAAFAITGTAISVAGATFTNTDTFVVYTNLPRTYTVKDDSAMEATPRISPVGGEYRASATTYTDGDAAVLQMDSKGNLKVAGGSSSVTAEFTSPSDFTATYTSSTTITLSSMPFTITDSSQLVYIRYIPTGGSNASVLVNGSDGVTLTVSSNVITVNGAGTPFASGDVYEIGINAQDKAYDASTQSMKESVLNPEYSRYTDAETLLSAAQDLTSALADVGSEVSCSGYNNVKFFVTQDVNTGTDLRYQILGKHESAGTEEYPLDSGLVKITAPNTWEGGTGSAFFEMDNDEDALFVITVDTSNSLPYLQLKAGAGSAGTTTGTAQIDALYVTKGY